MRYSIDDHYIIDWLQTLDKQSQVSIVASLELLSRSGPALKRPLVGKIEASKHKNMKELRPPSRGKSEIRILFAFDPERRAILLLGGDKSSGKFTWNKWYNKNIPVADKRYEEHLKQLGRKL